MRLHKLSWMFLTVAIVSLVFSLSAASVAAVINADNYPLLAGEQHTKAVLDTTANRLWLDVNETFGLSMNQVAFMLGSGGEYEGWQLPTLSDMEELLVNANTPYPTAPPGYDLSRMPGFNQPISDLVDIYGIANGTDLGDQLEIGIKTDMGIPFGRIVLSDGEYGNLGGHRARLMITIHYDADTAYDSVGIALFRPVPEPSTLVMLSIGAIGLLAFVWRRTRARAVID